MIISQIPSLMNLWDNNSDWMSIPNLLKDQGHKTIIYSYIYYTTAYAVYAYENHCAHIFETIFI